jgi:hypothetical protein
MFQASIAAAERADGVAALLERVHAHFTRALFAAVCRSLFEKDKLVFALLLAVRVLQSQARARARAVAAAGSCVTHQRHTRRGLSARPVRPDQLEICDAVQSASGAGPVVQELGQAPHALRGQCRTKPAHARVAERPRTAPGRAQGGVAEGEWAFLLTGGAADAVAGAPPPAAWLSPRAWREAAALGRLAHFGGLVASLAADGEAWRVVADGGAPHAAALPGGLDALSPFRRLLLARCLRCAPGVG